MSFNFKFTFLFKNLMKGTWLRYGKTLVTSCELRVTSHELRVTSHELKFQSARSNP